MQKYLFAINQTKTIFSTNVRKYSLSLKNGGPIFSRTAESLKRSKLSILLSIYGFLVTKEMLCDDKNQKASEPAQLYAWGGNQYGQLGIGSDLTKPTPERIETLGNIDIAHILAKPAISGALTKDGKIFTWGNGKTGALGHKNLSSINASLPAMIESLESYKFVQIGGGRYHMAAINDQGHLYTWGNLDHGVLGREIKFEAQNKKSFQPSSTAASKIQAPGKVEGELQNKTCIQVDCGVQHTICLTSDNQVYSWGACRRGVLGYSANEDIAVPKRIEFFDGKKVVKISAGYDFNYALTQDGKIYSWGNNYFGQLGIQSGSSVEVPTLITSLYGIKAVDIACGENFGAAITDKGKLYLWGCGNEGQLGHGNRTDLKTPKLLEFNQEVAAVDCGSSHTGIITKKGELYMFGRGREGQLGRADSIESSVTYRTTPQKVETFQNKKVVAVACGSDHTLALLQ